MSVLNDMKSMLLWKAYKKGPMLRTLARMLDTGKLSPLKTYREEKATPARKAAKNLIGRRANILGRSNTLRRMVVKGIQKAEGK